MNLPSPIRVCGCKRQLLLGELNRSTCKMTNREKVCVCVCWEGVRVRFHYAVKQHRTTEMTRYKQHNSQEACPSEKPLVKSVVCIFFCIHNMCLSKYLPRLYSHKRALSCAISSLNIPRHTHLILTSSVQLTKCRLENK